jgi:hypothetical protein
MVSEMADPHEGIFARLNSALVTSTAYTDATLQAGVSYRFGVTAVDTAGLESPMSNLANYTACAFTISPTSRSHSGSQETGSIALSCATGCTWSATSSAGWITITSGASGTGNGTVNYTVAANTTGSTRAASINVADKSFTVSQATQSTTPPPPTTTGTHIADLDGVVLTSGTGWIAKVKIKVVNEKGLPVAGATVKGTWSAGYSGTGTSTVTGSDGWCRVKTPTLAKTKTSVTFTVTSVVSANPYQASSNKDPDGDSNGTQITVKR